MFKTAFVVLACALVTSIPDEPNRGAALESPPSIELPAELDRVLRDYEKAWSEKDAVGLASLFSSDGFVLATGAPAVRGRDAIERHYSGQGGPLSLRAFAYATDGDLGTILGGYRAVTDEPDRGKFTLTLRREGDRWFIFSDMDNANARPR